MILELSECLTKAVQNSEIPNRCPQALRFLNLPLSTERNTTAATNFVGVRLDQVRSRHPYGLPAYDTVFHPHDVMGQCSDLRAGQGHAQAQIDDILAGQGTVHQVAALA